MAEPTQFNLRPDDLPTAWYNILPDLPVPPAPAAAPRDRASRSARTTLAPLFPDVAHHAGGLDRALASTSPDPCWTSIGCGGRRRCTGRAGSSRRCRRPRTSTSSTRAPRRPGSHKPNTAIARPTTTRRRASGASRPRPGAGQWGSALSLACQMFGLECLVFMVKASYEQKPYRRVFMETFGADGRSPRRAPRPRPASGSSPSTRTRPGSLGIAISEARGGRRHQRRHQLLAGERAQPRPAAPDGDRAGDQEADGDGRGVSRTSSSGASAAARTTPASPTRSWRDKLAGKLDARFIADRAGGVPHAHAGEVRLRLRRHRRAHAARADVHARAHVRPAPVHAGGLRYHGDAPLAVDPGARGPHGGAARTPRTRCSRRAIQFARAQGFIPGAEPTHAIRATIDEAIAAREAGESKVILFNLSGHGHFDMQAYDDYLNGRLPEIEFEEAALQEGFAHLPPGPDPRLGNAAPYNRPCRREEGRHARSDAARRAGAHPDPRAGGDFHPRQQIVTKTATGIERETYEDMAERAARLANALAGLGVRPGDRSARSASTRPGTWSSTSASRAWAPCCTR